MISGRTQRGELVHGRSGRVALLRTVVNAMETACLVAGARRIERAKGEVRRSVDDMLGCLCRRLIDLSVDWEHTKTASCWIEAVIEG